MLAAPHRWRNLLTWSPQVERWLETITSTRMSIDHLVVAVRELDVTDQVTSGLRWVERIVVRSGNDCAKTIPCRNGSMSGVPISLTKIK